MVSERIRLFDYPEFHDTFQSLFDKLLKESLRGAIIIGTAVVEDHLLNYILAVLPSKSGNYTSRLIKYPGPLSSFSAKIELSYAFRLLPKALYKSLNSLRIIRNEASHSIKNFSLGTNAQRLDDVFNLGRGFTTIVHESSTKMLIKSKVMSLKHILSEKGLSEEEADELIAEVMVDEKAIKALEQQVPFWKLISGLSLICSMLKYYSDETTKSLKGIQTWSEIEN